MHRLKVFLSIILVVGLVGVVGLKAQQEHPQEHPKEHPTREHPAAKPITTADLEKEIKALIADKAKASGGEFPVKDNVLDKTWALELVRVHTDKLTQLDANTYFACVDFKADDGTLVDVDFYLKSDKGKLAMTDITVHKINGQPRFNYVEKEGFWERVPVGGAEHPQAQAKKEHPSREQPK